ncbi:MAG: MMPL family transporter [Gemmataceae bacterium]|nr:MMPL family transporter [Gemmataceae bacterium]
MFSFIGRVVTRSWGLLLAVWIVLVLVGWRVAPSWNEVAQDREFAFLPSDAPSRRGEEVFRKAFPEDRLASSVVLVLHDPTADVMRDRKFISDFLEPSLRALADAEGGLADQPAPSDELLFSDEPAPPTPPKPVQRSIIAQIRTPNAPGSGALLVSPDGQVLLVLVELTTEFLSAENWPTIAKIEALAGDLRRQGRLPSNTDIFVTGSAVIGRDQVVGELQSAKATGALTVVLVIVLLVIIYRAPLLALIPLATVYLSVQAALYLLAILARAGHITLFQGIQIYITILAYGAGVDYCIFLTARYRELLAAGATPRDAVAGAIDSVGAAIAASAGTVICGIGMMVFAQFGKFRQAGIAIPLSLLVVLCATLTFAPALLRLTGRWAFWPFRPEAGQPSTPAEGLWYRSFSTGAIHRGWEKLAGVLLHRPGTIWLATVGLMAPFVIAALLLHGELSYDMIGNLPADAPSVVGTRVLQEHVPGGMIGPVTLLLVHPSTDFSTPQGQALVEALTTRMLQHRQELGLGDVRSLTAPLGNSPTAQGTTDDLSVPDAVRREATGRAALEHYTSSLGERARIGTRMDLVLEQCPFSRQSVTTLDRIEQFVRESLPEDVQLYFVGPTASVRDLEQVMREDRTRIEALVLLSVLVILVLLLRRLLVSLYLLASVLFSYYCTLGVTFAVFWLLDPHGFTGIDWKVAIFLFTILVAVGEDYNIFLMSRIDHEAERVGPVQGVTEALVRTGPIISSCGIIMAGTFAALIAGSLTEMKQLGFALAFGVLLDTFVVRPILVPAFLILLGRRVPPPSPTAG